MGLPIIGEAKALVRIHPFLRGLPTVSFHRMRRLMSALCPTTALTMEPPSVQSPFAQFRRYRCWGIVYRLLGGHYSSVFAPTDSCANPLWLSSPSAFRFVRRVFAGRYQPLLPAGSSRRYLRRIFPWMPDPIPRRYHSVPLPVSSAVSSAFPTHGVGRLPASDPLETTSCGSNISRRQIFLYVQASSFTRSPGRPYRCAYCRRAARALTSGHIVLRFLRTHRICYPSEHRQLTVQGLSPC